MKIDTIFYKMLMKIHPAVLKLLSTYVWLDWVNLTDASQDYKHN
jgi:hypothetical protein